MTVVVRTLTREGIVLAADGRCSGAIDGTIFSDSVQKIFPIKTPAGAFAYTISGAVDVLADGGREVAVDIAAGIRKSAENLAKKPARSLENYALRLCRPICQALKDANASGRFSAYPSFEPSIYGERGNTITRINIDGFRDGYPSSVAIRLFHENNFLGDPEITTETNYIGIHRILGSPEIMRLLWDTDDPRFSAYRGADVRPEQMTLALAIKRSRSYIQACSDAEAAAIDPICARVGGHIHIATISPLAEFEWVTAPAIPKPSQSAV